MEIRDLEDKVTNASEKVSKCKATINRHETQLIKKQALLTKLGIDINNMESFKRKPDGSGSQFYWEIVEVEGKQEDIKGAIRKLKDAETILGNWQSKLNIEIEKERFLNDNAPQVIKDFLEQWKLKAYDWHIKGYERYIVLKEQLEDAKKDAEQRFLAENPESRKWGREYDTFMKKDEEIKNIVVAIAMLGGAVATMATYRNEQERLSWLDRMLEADKKSKMIDLINRINKVVGTITDAGRLTVSEKGNLDGIIVGENSTAKIETIGAGGYNIQCFHFRTLVHELI